MYLGKTILAVVPARSGSKGVIDKNMKHIDGISLIGRAALCLKQLEWLDAKIISSDSESYILEGQKFDLDAPFIRPTELSNDNATAVDTITHALLESEKAYNLKFDVVLIIEPTSPFRNPEDIENTLKEMVNHNADSSISVSPLNSKYHPMKALKINAKSISHYIKHGENITSRQQLNNLYIRNGVCYAVSRSYLLEKRSLFSNNTRSYLINREIVNIDDPIDIEWAEYLIYKKIVKLEEF
jgi:CMP-N-acetylneuraminic acid synthetase